MNKVLNFLDKCYTIESVLQGHPDKVCDQISDAILDQYLSKDKNSKIAIECIGTGDTFFIGGEINSINYINIEKIVNEVYQNIGYTNPIQIINKINSQSDQIAKVVENGFAGDQAIVYGFACNQGENYLPNGIQLISKISRDIDKFRKESGLYLPDGKILITINNNEIKTLVLSIQHDLITSLVKIKSEIINNVIRKYISIDSLDNFYFNYNSSFFNGGIVNDTGVTGRKIMVDTYCGIVPHGGGAFSGKDPSKVDRSASYMARFVAKNIVANGLCESCLISISYCFGLEEPVMLNVESGNTKLNQKLQKIIRDKFDFRIPAIIAHLDLLNFKYSQTASYGHFTNVNYPWEQIISI